MIDLRAGSNDICLKGELNLFWPYLFIKMDLESLVANTIRVVGNLVAKPKMSEKHLSKPPFRFLHDVISAITRETGFGEGLYSGDELDAKSITDKSGKIDYLNKIFNLVGICKVRVLNCAF